MAKGIDDWKNGALLGLLAGLLVYYTASLEGSFLTILGTTIDNLSTWLLAQTWMSWAASFSVKTLSWVLAGLFGGIIGAIIDSS